MNSEVSVWRVQMTMNSVRLTKVLAQTTAIAALFAISGCLSSPTYGTGVTSNEQLVKDVGSSFSFKPKTGPKIAYEPRPELLKEGAAKGLPAPQESVTKTAGVWPESNEERRARLNQQATDAQNDPLYVSNVIDDSGGSKATVASGGNPNDDRNARKYVANDTGLSARVKAARTLNATGSPTKRATLSEPPIDYRQPASTAAYGDIGEDEAKKERRLRAEAKKKNGTKGFRDYIPGL